MALSFCPTMTYSFVLESILFCSILRRKSVENKHWLLLWIWPRDALACFWLNWDHFVEYIHSTYCACVLQVIQRLGFIYRPRTCRNFLGQNKSHFQKVQVIIDRMLYMFPSFRFWTSSDFALFLINELCMNLIACPLHQLLQCAANWQDKSYWNSIVT